LSYCVLVLSPKPFCSGIEFLDLPSLLDHAHVTLTQAKAAIMWMGERAIQPLLSLDACHVCFGSLHQ
jgi:hypothetical protein